MSRSTEPPAEMSAGGARPAGLTVLAVGPRMHSTHDSLPAVFRNTLQVVCVAPVARHARRGWATYPPAKGRGTRCPRRPHRCSRSRPECPRRWAAADTIPGSMRHRRRGHPHPLSPAQRRRRASPTRPADGPDLPARRTPRSPTHRPRTPHRRLRPQRLPRGRPRRADAGWVQCSLPVAQPQRRRTDRYLRARADGSPHKRSSPCGAR